MMLQHRRKNTKSEIEFKWAAPSPKTFEALLQNVKRLGARLGLKRNVILRDTYYDSPAFDLLAKGIKCRIRKTGAACELTLKTNLSRTKEMVHRNEETWVLKKAGRGQLSLNSELQLIKKILSPRLGTISPVLLFRLTNHRLIVPIFLADGTVAEASLDRVQLNRGKRKRNIQEIEFEFVKGSETSFKRLARKLVNETPLKPSSSPKFDTAMHLYKPY